MSPAHANFLVLFAFSFVACYLARCPHYMSLTRAEVVNLSASESMPDLALAAAAGDNTEEMHSVMDIGLHCNENACSAEKMFGIGSWFSA